MGIKRGREEIGRNRRVLQGRLGGVSREELRKKRAGNLGFLLATVNHYFADFLSHEADLMYGTETGEKTLIRAVIYRAVLDACQARASVTPAHRDCARRWLAADSVEPYSYIWCCDNLDIEDCARHAIRTAYKCANLDLERMIATPRGGH